MVLLGFFSDLGILIIAALIYCVVTPAREIAKPRLNGTLFGLPGGAGRRLHPQAAGAFRESMSGFAIRMRACKND